MLMALAATPAVVQLALFFIGAVVALVGIFLLAAGGNITSGGDPLPGCIVGIVGLVFAAGGLALLYFVATSS